MLGQFSHLLKRNMISPNNIISFILGLCLVFSYAPFSHYWLVFIILPTWLFRIRKASIREATKQGFIFAFGWFSAGISWVHVSIDQFGGLPLVASLLLMLLLCLYLAIYPAIACYCSAKFSHSKTINLYLFVPFWLICEFLRGVMLTGFPWLTLGYSQIDSPLSAYAPIIGESGISALILIICVSLVYIVTKVHRLAHSLIVISVCILTFVFHNISWVKESRNTVNTLLVQGNIEQALKWAPEQTWPSMLSYLDLTRQHYPADIIVWPESAITAVEPSIQAQEFLQIVQSSLLLNDSSLITGIIDYDADARRYFNNLIVLGQHAKKDQIGSYQYNNLNRYSKHHLLPIGEFVPFADWLRPIAPFFNLPMSSFSRGHYQQKNLVANGYQVLPLICFEVAFADQLSANFSEQTQLLLTVSNDAWFGDSHGPHQHLDIVRMRAKEFGRPFLRATNNGITAVIDHHGNVVNRIPQFETNVLTTQVNLVSGTTPYARFTTIIDYGIPTLLLLFAVLYQYRIRQSV